MHYMLHRTHKQRSPPSCRLSNVRKRSSYSYTQDRKWMNTFCPIRFQHSTALWYKYNVMWCKYKLSLDHGRCIYPTFCFELWCVKTSVKFVQVCHVKCVFSISHTLSLSPTYRLISVRMKSQIRGGGGHTTTSWVHYTLVSELRPTFVCLTSPYTSRQLQPYLCHLPKNLLSSISLSGAKG